MRRLFSRFLVVAFAVALAFSVVACGGGLDKVAKGLSNYSISLDFDGDKTITAQQKIDYINNYEVPLDELKLHLYPNAYRQGASPCPADDITSRGGIEIVAVRAMGADVEFEVGGSDQNILTVPFSSQLYPAKRAAVEIDFTLTVPTTKHRFGQYNGSYNLGNFYPIACVYSGGEFLTDPYYKSGDPFVSECANYTVSLTAPESFSVASVGRTTASTLVEGRRTDTFKAQAVRSFALVMSEGLEVASGQAGKTVVNYFFSGEDDASYSLDLAISALKTFNNLFGQYPYDTYNVVSTSFYTGGMEYSGMVLINSSLSREERDQVIVHETAHQWWYGLVGNDEVREAWIDEALAEYSTTIFYEKNPDYGISRADRTMDALRNYMSITRVFEAVQGNVDTSMNRRLDQFATTAEYSCMVYTKGQIMWDNIRNLVGDKAFFAALKNYATANSYKLVSKAHIIGAFENASGRDLEGVFDSWLSGKVILTDLI